MKCTIDFLKLHTEAMDNIYLPKAGKPINIYEGKKLNDQLKQRLEMAIDLEIAMKVASIVFFDKNENTEDFDFAYNIKKVEHWKKHDGVFFFARMPLQELMPVLKSIGTNLKQYSEVVNQLNEMHLESLLRNLPESKTQTLKSKSYFSAVVMPVS